LILDVIGPILYLPDLPLFVSPSVKFQGQKLPESLSWFFAWRGDTHGRSEKKIRIVAQE
jgi:hypothetical protein